MEPEPWCLIAAASDVRVVTSATRKAIPVHSKILGSSSPVLEHVMANLTKTVTTKKKSTTLPLLGVSYNAVVVFLRCLYSSSECLTKENMSEYGMHLLVLCHVLGVEWLKRAVMVGLAVELTVDNVVDMMQLAHQCDAPRLYVQCLSLVQQKFKVVEQSEGWMFVQEHDPCLELDVLQFLQETEKREKSWKRRKTEREVYKRLGEIMDCIRHICADGCTVVGPHHRRPPPPLSSAPTHRRPEVCRWGSTCRELQELIRHFAVTCQRKNGGCVQCNRMRHLFRLHSILCDGRYCTVPLCKRFKEKKVGVDKNLTTIANNVKIGYINKQLYTIHKG